MCITAAEHRVLQAVAKGDVSWRVHGTRARTYRLWVTEDAYEVVTKQGAELKRRGLIQCDIAAGYSYTNYGPCQLTPAGEYHVAYCNFDRASTRSFA